MKMVKNVGLLVSAALLAVGINAQAADATSMKVAVVNVQEVLQQSPRVADLSKKLEAQFKARQTKIADEQKSVQDEMDKFNKESPTLSQKQKDAMQKKIGDDRAELVKKVVAYQQDLQKEQNRVMQGILGDLNSIVTKIANAQGYDLVLDAQAVIYAKGGNNITKAVSDEFNKKG